jgi:hypothetical protein
MRGIIQVLILLVYCNNLHAQLIFSGTVKDEKGAAIKGANVLLKDAKGLIIQFSNTGNNGYYDIIVSKALTIDGLLIEVKHISYETMQQPVEKNRLLYDFVLKEAVQSLNEVTVRQRPIVNKGDTIRYNVAFFAKEEDRTIEDVMKRMPGIDIAEDGTISFNGKKIGNLYTGGDDLMDGRYGAATKAIKKEMIETIEIIQQHQPVKVLRNKKPTDNIGLNLVLKDENSWKVSGLGMAGAGLPGLYTANLNAVMLNKKVKTINSVKANNTGEDYRSEIARLSLPGDNEQPVLSDILSSGTAGDPDLPRRNYYINNSGLVNINYLFKNKKDIQFRTNVQGFTDKQRVNYYNQTQLFTATDTIGYFEQLTMTRRPWQLNGSINLQANKEKYYLNNRTSLELGASGENSSLTTQSAVFSQQLTGRQFALGNEFHVIPALKTKGIMELTWNIHHARRPQSLFINDGLHVDLLNEGMHYQAMIQEAMVKVLQNNAHVSYLLIGQKFRQQYKLALLQENKQLESALTLAQNNGSWNKYRDDAGNNLYWNRYRASMSADYSWVKANRYEVSISIPVTLQHIRYRQEEYALSEKYNRFWVNPSLAYKKWINAEEYFSASYGYKNSLSDMHSVYRGVVLTNYRSLQANDAPLQEKSGHIAGITYSFQRTLQMLFLNGGLSFTSDRVNTLLSTRITNDIKRNVLLAIPNTRNSWQLQGGGSKYLYFLKATMSFKTNYSITRMQQYINEELIPVKFHSANGSVSLDKKLFNKVSLNYAGNYSYSFMKQQVKDGNKNNMQRLDQQLNSSFTLFKGLLFQVQVRNIYSRSNDGMAVNYWFADTRLRYPVKKWKMDLDLDCTNIANINRYELLRVDASFASMSHYDIRGRMLLLRVAFNF